MILNITEFSFEFEQYHEINQFYLNILILVFIAISNELVIFLVTLMIFIIVNG
jgi:hypothetical protein